MTASTVSARMEFLSRPPSFAATRHDWCSVTDGSERTSLRHESTERPRNLETSIDDPLLEDVTAHGDKERERAKEDDAVDDVGALERGDESF